MRKAPSKEEQISSSLFDKLIELEKEFSEKAKVPDDGGWNRFENDALYLITFYKAQSLSDKGHKTDYKFWMNRIDMNLRLIKEYRVAKLSLLIEHGFEPDIFQTSDSSSHTP